MKTSSLYLWLVSFLLRSARPDKPAEDKVVQDKMAAVFGMEFLGTKGKRYQEKIQLVTRLYAAYLIDGNRPIQGIAPIMRAIRMCSASEEEVSGLHTQFAKLCLKARCF